MILLKVKYIAMQNAKVKKYTIISLTDPFILLLANFNIIISPSTNNFKPIRLLYILLKILSFFHSSHLHHPNTFVRLRERYIKKERLTPLHKFYTSLFAVGKEYPAVLRKCQHNLCTDSLLRVYLDAYIHLIAHFFT